MTSVLAQEPWKYDSKVIPMPWRQAEEDGIKSKIASGGLTLGFYNCDGVVSSTIHYVKRCRKICTVLKINRSSLIRQSFEESKLS